MAFSTYCTNKGCLKFNEPVLDETTNEVVCVECEKPIANLTEFIKRQLKDEKRVKKSPKIQKAFSLTCGECKATDVPKLEKKVLWCSHCGADLKASAPFIETFKNRAKANK